MLITSDICVFEKVSVNPCSFELDSIRSSLHVLRINYKCSQISWCLSKKIMFYTNIEQSKQLCKCHTYYDKNHYNNYVPWEI